MKKLFTLILLLVIGIAGYLIYQRPELADNFFKQTQTPKSGLVASAKTTNTVWSPKTLDVKTNIAPPVIDSKAALVAEITTSKIIYTKNPDLKLPVGSVQKIVSAMVTLDHKQETDIIPVSQNAASKEPDSMGIFPGERLTIKQLLYGTLLVSGNDAATALAEGVSGDEKSFAELMNKKAESLGLENSHFVNANGLDEDEHPQYTTANDLATFAVDFERNYPLLAKIVSTQEYLIPEVFTEIENHKNFYLYNTSPLASYPGFIGIKPGYTPNAGMCLMTLVEKNNKQYLVIVLGSNDRKGDTEALLEYAYQVDP